MELFYFNLLVPPHHLWNEANVSYMGFKASHALIPNFPHWSPKERSLLMLPFPESFPSHTQQISLFKT